MKRKSFIINMAPTVKKGGLLLKESTAQILTRKKILKEHENKLLNIKNYTYGIDFIWNELMIEHAGLYFGIDLEALNSVVDYMSNVKKKHNKAALITTMPESISEAIISTEKLTDPKDTRVLQIKNMLIAYVLSHSEYRLSINTFEMPSLYTNDKTQDKNTLTRECILDIISLISCELHSDLIVDLNMDKIQKVIEFISQSLVTQEKIERANEIIKEIGKIITKNQPVSKSGDRGLKKSNSLKKVPYIITLQDDKESESEADTALSLPNNQQFDNKQPKIDNHDEHEEPIHFKGLHMYDRLEIPYCHGLLTNPPYTKNCAVLQIDETPDPYTRHSDWKHTNGLYYNNTTSSLHYYSTPEKFSTHSDHLTKESTSEIPKVPNNTNISNNIQDDMHLPHEAMYHTHDNPFDMNNHPSALERHEPLVYLGGTVIPTEENTSSLIGISKDVLYKTLNNVQQNGNTMSK